MYFLYSLALTLGFAVIFPYFIYLALKHGKYVGNVRQRLGSLPDSVICDGSPCIWIHTVSVGEFIAAQPLIERIRQEFQSHRLILSTTTLTGQELARNRAGDEVDVFYFPFDWSFTVRRALNRLSPSLVIILETELWPNFLRLCKERNIPTVIANGRISTKSFRRYLFFKFFIKDVLKNVSLLLMQSEADAERARLLGAAPDRVHVCGNLKYDVAVYGDSSSSSEDAGIDIDHQFDISGSSHVIVAGSTAPGEEEMLLASLREIRNHEGLEQTRMILAPRHPERFGEVHDLLSQSGFTYGRRSEKTNYEETPDVILLDTIGELASTYRFASVVFVGGSLVPRGGHNIIEPAVYARPIIVGPFTDNFRQITDDFKEAGAVTQLENQDSGGLTLSLSAELIRLLSDSDAAAAQGANGRRILEKNQGATADILDKVQELLSK